MTRFDYVDHWFIKFVHIFICCLVRDPSDSEFDLVFDLATLHIQDNHKSDKNLFTSLMGKIIDQFNTKTSLNDTDLVYVRDPSQSDVNLKDNKMTGASFKTWMASLFSAAATSGSYTDLTNKPTLGTAAPLNVGTSANNILQLDSNAKLPAVDGSQLTNINAGTNYIGDYKYSSQSASHGKWLLCQGAAISRSTYSALFTVIGTSFGNGDGSTTFNLPDTRSSVLGSVGQRSGLTNRTIGTFIGEENHTLITNEIPSHTHGTNVPLGGIAGSGGTVMSNGINSTPITTSTGGGASHNNMQPTLFVGNTFVYAGV